MVRTDLIKGQMAAKGLTVEKLAKAKKISTFTVISIRKGNKTVSVANYEKVAEALSLPLSKLFEPPTEPAQTS